MTTSLLRQRIYAELPLETDPHYGFGLTAAEIARRTGWHQGVIYAELCAMEAAHLALPYRRTEHAPARWIRILPASTHPLARIGQNWPVSKEPSA